MIPNIRYSRVGYSHMTFEFVSFCVVKDSECREVKASNYLNMINAQGSICYVLLSQFGAHAGMQGSSMQGANSVLASKMDNSFVVLPKQRPQAQGVPPRPRGGAGNASQTGKAMDESFVVVYKSESSVDGGGAQSPSPDGGPNGPLQPNNSGFHSTITLLKRAFEIATTQTQVCITMQKILSDLIVSIDCLPQWWCHELFLWSK